MTETRTTEASPVLPRVAAHRRLLDTVLDLQRQRRTAVPGDLICVAMNAASDQARATVSNQLAGLLTTGYIELAPLRDNPRLTGYQLTAWGSAQLALVTDESKAHCKKPLETPEPRPFSNAEQPSAQSLSLACLLCDLAEVLSAQIAVAQEAGDWAEVRRLMDLGQRTINAEKELTE